MGCFFPPSPLKFPLPPPIQITATRSSFGQRVQHGSCYLARDGNPLPIFRVKQIPPKFKPCNWRSKAYTDRSPVRHCSQWLRGRPHGWSGGAGIEPAGGEENAREAINKPGSVHRWAPKPPPVARPLIWDCRCRQPRASYPAARRATSMPPYLDLLRMGFTWPAPSPAPRWALTLRPRQDRRPHLFTLACAHPPSRRTPGPPSAVCFLWHFP